MDIVSVIISGEAREVHHVGIFQLEAEADGTISSFCPGAVASAPPSSLCHAWQAEAGL